MSDSETVFVDHAAALGGAELYLLDVVRGFEGRCRVILFERGPLQDELQLAGIKVDIVESGAGLSGVRKRSGLLATVSAIPATVRMVFALKRRLTGAGVVLLNSQKSLVVGALAAKLARVPAVWNLHDILTAAHFGNLNRRVAVGIAKRYVSRVIANSLATRDALFASGYGKDAPVDIVYNGIDSSIFKQTDREKRSAVRRALGLPIDATVVGLFGRLSEWKGQHVLIEALARVEGVHALVVGGALFSGDQDYERRLVQQINSLGLQDRVLMVGFRSDVAILMGCCDIIAHTSTAPEPFGRVIVEAMLSGIPVIASAAGGALEIIEHGSNGLSSEPGDVDALARCLSRLRDNPDEAAEFAKRAHADAEEKFSIEQMVEGVTASLRLARSHV